jgi:glyceraldehyde 3-phosphate dehydrogenase
MTLRIGINGFGRIGRTVTRILQGRNDMRLVAVNDLARIDQLAYALKYDSVYRGFPGDVQATASGFEIDGRPVRISATPAIVEIDWQGVDYVIEATGKFRKRAQVADHLRDEVRAVVLTVPAKDELDATIVLGANDALLKGSERVVSNASCTTNAAAPVTGVIHSAFGIVRGYINTIHSYTNDQRLIDFPHDDHRRSRAAALSIIPTSTGAAKAVAAVFPELKGRLDGTAYRVPTPDGSIVDMLFQVERPVSVAEVNQAVRAACDGPLQGIVQYCEDPIVSADVVGNSHSGIFDAGLTQIIDGQFVKVAVWYDNEYGYSCRVVDLIAKLAALR